MSEDVTFWVVMAAGALVVVGVPGWLLWIWALFRTRGDLWLVVQLSGARAPYPRRPVRGLLRVTRERVTWGAYWGAGGLDLGSTGLQALYPRPVTPRDRTNQSVALVCRDGRGTPVTVRVHPVFVDRVMTVLVDRPLPAQPEPPAVRRSRPTVTSVLPLLLIAAGVAVLPVALRDSGNGVLGSPAFPLAVSLVVAGTGAFALALRARRLAAPAPGSPLQPAVAAAPALPRDATWRELSATAAVAGVAEDWPTSRSPAADTNPGSYLGTGDPGARAGRRRIGTPAGLAGLVVTLVVAGFFLWPLLVPPFTSYSTLWRDAGTTARTDAWIVATQRTLPLLTTGNVTVDVETADGAVASAVVPVTNLPGDDEDTVAVEYSVDAPERAWAVQDDARALGAVLGAVALLLLVGYVGRAAVTMTRVGVAQRQSLRGGAVHRTLYVITLGDMGRYILLLFGEHPDSLPRFGMGVTETAVRDLPVAGRLELHGALEEGIEAVPVVQGRPLATSSPLAMVGPEQALQLFERYEDLVPRPHGPARHRADDGADESPAAR